MNNQKKSQYTFFSNKYFYVFLDESGNSNNKMWHKVEDAFKQDFFCLREYSTYTLAGVFIKSWTQNYFLKKELTKLKKDILGLNSNDLVHRNTFHDREFIKTKNITPSDVNRFYSEIYQLINKHNLKIFSVSFNREIIYKKSNFSRNYYFYNFCLLNLIVREMMKIIYNFYIKSYLSMKDTKKIILVFEETDKKKEKKIINIFNSELEENENYKRVFKAIKFNSKKDKNNKTIVGNEIVDFAVYPIWLWSSNTNFQNLKSSFYSFPNYEENSMILIDKISQDEIKIKNIESFKKNINIQKEIL